MNNSIKTGCLFCFLLFLSCNEKEHTEAIKIDSQVEDIMLSEIVDSITVIPLETTDECLIGYINEIRYYNGHYHIYDHKNKSIFTFDEKGKFFKKFHKHGYAQGEYLTISGFRFDTDGYLHVLDNLSSKIMKYDVKKDSLLASIQIDRNFPRDFTVFENNYLLYIKTKKDIRQGGYAFYPDENNYKKTIDMGEWTEEFVMNSYISPMQNLDYVVADNISGNKVYEMRADSVINCYEFVAERNYRPNNNKLFGYHLIRCSKAEDIIFMIFIDIDGRNSLNVPTYDRTTTLTIFFNSKTEKFRTFNEIDNGNEKLNLLTNEVWSLNGKFVVIHYGKTDKTGFELNPELHILHLKKNFLD